MATSTSTSAGRKKAGSITRWSSMFSPTCLNAITHMSRTVVVRPVAMT